MSLGNVGYNIYVVFWTVEIYSEYYSDYKYIFKVNFEMSLLISDVFPVINIWLKNAHLNEYYIINKIIYYYL